MKIASLLLVVGTLIFAGNASAQDAATLEAYNRAVDALMDGPPNRLERAVCVLFLKDAHPDQTTLEKLHELHELRKALWTNDKERNLGCPQIPAWVDLINANAPLPALAWVDNQRVVTLADELHGGRIPLHFPLLMATDEKAFADYVPAFAQSFEGDADALQKRLETHQHLYCAEGEVNCDRGPSTIQTVTSPVMRGQVEAWLDYMESGRGQQIAQLLPGPLWNNIEHGGILFGGNGKKIIFVSTDPDPYTKDKEKASKYIFPIIVAYLPILGVVHSHPMPQGYAPSDANGPSKKDIGLHDDYASVDPYRVDAVVSEVSTNEVDVTLYFRDVRMNGKGNPEPFGYLIVIDLGIYSKSTPPPTLKRGDL